MPVITRFAGPALGLGVALASAGAALAETHDIDGITVTVSGRVDPTTALDVSQPTPASVFGSPYIAINLGQPGGANPYAPNPGWDPYGLSDTTHHWINIGDNSTGGIYNLTGGLLSIIWGSPNDTVPTSSNAVTFYSGLNGGGSVLGTVLSSDLYDNFAGINNTQDPGYLVSFLTPEAFRSVSFSTGPSAFEFAVTGVPEPKTWAMMMAGFGGLAFLGWKRKRQPIALAL